MRLKYALKFWFVTFLVGFGGLFLLALRLHNPNAVEIAGPWYYGLVDMVFQSLPFVIFISLLFFPLGFILYHPQSEQYEGKRKIFTLSSLKKTSMLPAYITTLLTFGALRLYTATADNSGEGGLVVGAMVLLFLVIIIPINIVVWIVSIRKSRTV